MEAMKEQDALSQRSASSLEWARVTEIDSKIAYNDLNSPRGLYQRPGIVAIGRTVPRLSAERLSRMKDMLPPMKQGVSITPLAILANESRIAVR